MLFLGGVVMYRKMILGALIGLICLLQISFIGIFAQDASNKEPIKPDNQQTTTVDVDQINRLIKELNSDDITARDKATEELRKIGKPALSYLIEAAKSDIPEVAWRAKIIIRAIEKDEQKKPDVTAPGQGRATIRVIPNITVRPNALGIKSYSYSKDSSGKITVTITEYDKEGKQETKTYTADSEEEFKQKYPEIAKEYGIGEQHTFKFDIPDIDMDDIWKDFGNAWDLRLDDMRKEMDRLRDMLRKQMEEMPGQENPPPQQEPEDQDRIKPQLPPLSATNLGIYIETVDNGVEVKNIEKNSLAEKMGLKIGDIITDVNDTAVKNIWECRRLVKESLEKGRIKLNIIREGKKTVLVFP